MGQPLRFFALDMECVLPDEPNKGLERRGHVFCRYAACMVYVQARRAGERVMESISRFLESKLTLKVNREKSAVGLGGGYSSATP